MTPSQKLAEALEVLRSGRVDKGRQMAEVALRETEKMERELADLRELMGK